MDHDQRELLASAAIVGIFFLVQVGALALVDPFVQEGLQEVEDTDDPSLSIFYLLAILIATALMLVAIKHGGDAVLRLIIIFAGVYIALFVFEILIPALLTVTVGGFSINILAWVSALVLGIFLYFYPEWYVIDIAGIIMAIGAAALFGINFGILPALVLLVALAVYDAISVYGTEHMLALASGMMDMRVPVVFVVPLSLSFTFLDEEKPDTVDSDADEQPDPDELDVGALNDLGPEGVRDLNIQTLREIDLDENEAEALDGAVRDALEKKGSKRDALYIGLGDAVIPTVLVASAAFFIDTGPTLSIAGISATLPAVTAMVGTMIGLVVLLWLVKQGRAHAGLPLLNGGAIAGYLAGALASGLTLVEALGLSGFL